MVICRAARSQTVQATGLAVEDEDTLAIVHRLCAEAIAGSTLPAERHALHAALAEVFVAEPAESAWHWTRALRPVEARAAHLAAAAKAELVEPGPTALLHYTATLELGADAPDGVGLLAAAAAAADASGAFRRAATLAEQAIERLAGGRAERLLAAARGRDVEREEAARLSEQLGRYRRSSGDSNGARAGLRAGPRTGSVGGIA